MPKIVAAFLPYNYRTVMVDLMYAFGWTPSMIGAMRPDEILMWHDGLNDAHARYRPKE